MNAEVRRTLVPADSTARTRLEDAGTQRVDHSDANSASATP